MFSILKFISDFLRVFLVTTFTMWSAVVLSDLISDWIAELLYSRKHRKDNK